jgi:hypothetical protein
MAELTKPATALEAEIERELRRPGVVKPYSPEGRPVLADAFSPGPDPRRKMVEQAQAGKLDQLDQQMPPTFGMVEKRLAALVARLAETHELAERLSDRIAPSQLAAPGGKHGFFGIGGVPAEKPPEMPIPATLLALLDTAHRIVDNIGAEQERARAVID